MGSSLVSMGNDVASAGRCLAAMGSDLAPMSSSSAPLGRIMASMRSDLVLVGSFDGVAGQVFWRSVRNFYGGGGQLDGFL